jgi:hypothetical protein
MISKLKKINTRKLLKRLGLRYTESKSPNELILDCVDPNCPNPHGHMYLNKESGLWLCHRCGIAGNLVVLVSIVKKITARNAQRVIEDETTDTITIEGLKDRLKNIDKLYLNIVDILGMKIYAPPPQNSILVSRTMYPKFLNDRNIPFGLALRAGVRICNSGKYAGRLIFPFKCDGNESFVAYASAGQKPKTLNPPGGMNDRMIYDYDYMKKIWYSLKHTDSLIVVEGIFDCLRLQLYGFPCVSLLGSFLSKNKAILLSQMPYAQIIFMLDGDIKIDDYWKHLRNFNYVSGKNIFFAPILDEKKDPDTLSQQEVINILDYGMIPATDSYRMKARLSKIIGEVGLKL